MPLRLGEALLEQGLVSREALERALETARTTRDSLFHVLVKTRLVAEDVLLRLVAGQQGLEFVSLKETPVDARAINSLAPKFAAHYRVMPVRLQDGVLTIAVSNPFDMAAEEDIETNLGYQVQRVLACEPDIGVIERGEIGHPGGHLPALRRRR